MLEPAYGLGGRSEAASDSFRAHPEGILPPGWRLQAVTDNTGPRDRQLQDTYVLVDEYNETMSDSFRGHPKFSPLPPGWRLARYHQQEGAA